MGTGSDEPGRYGVTRPDEKYLNRRRQLTCGYMSKKMEENNEKEQQK